MGHGHVLHAQLLRLQLSLRCHIMQIVERALLLGTLTEELWFMQPTYIFIEDVFVVCETGQGTVYCVIQSEEFLCVFIKSLMWSLSPLFQCIDCINHGGKRREFHL